MKILFTGGGTGGHFYPIIAVIDALEDKVREQKILEPQMYYMATSQYDARALFDRNITFKKVGTGKIRNYFSILNFFDYFRIFFGVIKATMIMFSIYPDVVFGKGGYSSFPALMAAKILRIPVIIHESDTVPGRVNAWAGKFAKKVAVSWSVAEKYFPTDKVAWTGNPVRHNILNPLKEGATELLKLEKDTPVILIIGGSQGAMKINNTILDILPELVEKYQIIHQVGPNNFKEISAISETILKNSAHKDRYKPFDYLNELSLRMAAGVATITISRAGSSIFEIAGWGVPAILIPIPEPISHDQTKNAIEYAKTGSCVVLEESNLTPHILMSEIDRLMDSAQTRETMSKNAVEFAKKDAAGKIADAILGIALEHEK